MFDNMLGKLVILATKFDSKYLFEKFRISSLKDILMTSYPECWRVYVTWSHKICLTKQVEAIIFIYTFPLLVPIDKDLRCTMYCIIGVKSFHNLCAARDFFLNIYITIINDFMCLLMSPNLFNILFVSYSF